MHWTLTPKAPAQNHTGTDLTPLTLHEQYDWADEYDWTSLAQSEPVYLLNGAMDIQQGTKQAGRAITLDGTQARMTRQELKKLQAWTQIPELEMTLTHPNGDKHTVIFARPALINVRAVKAYRPIDQTDEDKMTATVCLLVV